MFERKSLQTSWTEAVGKDDYAAAQRLLLAEDAARWRAAADQLRQQHGRVQGVETGQYLTPGPNQQLIIRVKQIWTDGYTRCLEMRETSSGHIDILSDGYHDCTASP